MRRSQRRTAGQRIASHKSPLPHFAGEVAITMMTSRGRVLDAILMANVLREQSVPRFQSPGREGTGIEFTVLLRLDLSGELKPEEL